MWGLVFQTAFLNVADSPLAFGLPCVPVRPSGSLQTLPPPQAVDYCSSLFLLAIQVVGGRGVLRHPGPGSAF